VPDGRLEISQDSERFEARRDGVTLVGERVGSGPPVLLLHGLTATRRYVVHGSRAIERAGHTVVGYDARAHGESSPAEEYSYDELIADVVAVLDHLGLPEVAVAGQSMGAATAAGLALTHPERVRSLVLITPAHLGAPSHDLERWDRLAAGLDAGGPEGFLDALGPLGVPDRWESAVRTVIQQRIERHLHPRAVAEALRRIPRTAAFDGVDALAGIDVPTLVVGSRDRVDPDHPLATAERYAEVIPGARLVVEGPEESPLAWRGGALSTAILEHVGD
jgi:pimeloyl-ACP methyl ester carboxylesterase